MITAIYPGTFDPITKGHVDIIQRASRMVDRLIIGVADDIPKTPIFSLDERVAMVENDIADIKGDIKVIGFKGLLVDFAAAENADIIVRGLRAVSDFEYEFQLSAMNSRLNNDVQTVFLPSSENNQFIASKLVKEVARLGGDVNAFVSKHVANCLKEFYG